MSSGKRGRKEGGGGEEEMRRLRSAVRYASCVYALCNQHRRIFIYKRKKNVERFRHVLAVS